MCTAEQSIREVGFRGRIASEANLLFREVAGADTAEPRDLKFAARHAKRPS